MIPGSVSGSGVISGAGIKPPISISTDRSPSGDTETSSPGTEESPLTIASNTGLPSFVSTLHSPAGGMGVVSTFDSLSNVFPSPSSISPEMTGAVVWVMRSTKPSKLTIVSLSLFAVKNNLMLNLVPRIAAVPSAVLISKEDSFLSFFTCPSI